MPRPWQHLCRQVLARPIGPSPLRKHTPPASLRATVTTIATTATVLQARPSRRRHLPSPGSPSSGPSTSPRRRSLTTSRPLLAEPSETTPETAPPSSGPQPPKRRRRRRGLYYATLFLLIGTAVGTFARITIAPPPLPAPGSDQDAYLQRRIQSQGTALPIVRQLSTDPSWTSWDAYTGISTTPSAARPRVTSGPMSGSSGLAFQRIFHNAATGEVVTVVYFGAGLAGWPGVVHGGALATVLDESLGRCAILAFPSRTGVTANLELQYRAPTLTNNFYVVRSTPVVVNDDDKKKSERKLWVRGTLETAEKGKVTVEAKGLFVVPKGYQLPPLVEGF